MQLTPRDIEANYGYFSELVERTKAQIMQGNRGALKLKAIRDLGAFGVQLGLDDQEYWQGLNREIEAACSEGG